MKQRASYTPLRSITLPDAEFLTLGHAAARVGVSPSRMRQLIDQGKVRAARASDGSRLPFADSVEEFLSAR